MEIDEILKKAWEAVEKAKVPEHVQPYAFREAVRLLKPRAPVRSAPTATAAPAKTSSEGASAGTEATVSDVSEDEMLERVAAQTGADRALLEQLVHLDDDGPRISIPGVKLGRNNAEATRAIAGILTVVRDFGFSEKETHIDLIRKEADRLRVYDSGNFSTYINSVTGFQVVGSGSSRRLRAKSPGIAAFPDLVDQLVGKS